MVSPRQFGARCGCREVGPPHLGVDNHAETPVGLQLCAVHASHPRNAFHCLAHRFEAAVGLRRRVMWRLGRRLGRRRLASGRSFYGCTFAVRPATVLRIKLPAPSPRAFCAGPKPQQPLLPLLELIKLLPWGQTWHRHPATTRARVPIIVCQHSPQGSTNLYRN